MPDPNTEHGLRVQLATALRERDEAMERERCSVGVLQRTLAASRAECETLISSVMHLRLVGAQMATFIEEQMPLFGGVSSEFDGEGEPRELLSRWRKADKIADKSYGPAALAAPAAGEEKENAGRWVLPSGGTGFVEPPAICNACGEPLLTRNIFVDDGCPCNSPRGVNVKPAPCSLCRTDNCVKPAHRLWDARK